MLPWRTQGFLSWILLCQFSFLARASAPGPLRTPQVDAISLSRSKMYRWRQRSMTNQKVHKRRPISIAGVTSATKGSLLTLQRPTTERVSRWFWGKDTIFNHNSVGMTNPCLHIAVTEDASCSSHNPSTAKALPVSQREENVEEIWWPQTACPLENTSWRVLRYRRRVGRGSACYQRVRDAALQWEFSSPEQDKGMLQVTPPQPTISSKQNEQHRRNRRGYTVLPISELDDIYAPNTSDQIMKIWSGPGRRLVTFTRSGLPLPTRFQWMLPCLYAINPVAVVYDLVDERGPATTYTSTAYATAKGHLLRGEERVTVALRDNGHVDVEIISFSKPAASVKGRLVWPVIGGMQQTFFEQEMSSLERVAQTQGELESEDIVSNMIRIQ
jgi:uncharacterized protein (UPF0548 family)